MEKPTGRWGIVCDFDGTITMEDVAAALVAAYAPSESDRWDADFTAGRMDVQELIRRQFAAVKAPRDEMIRHVLEQVVIRPGFPEFVTFCQERNLPLVIASAGLDFYIEAILRQAVLVLPTVMYGMAEFTPNGVLVSYEHLFEEAEAEFDLKVRAVARMRRTGRRVAYIGDGRPDLPAARLADLVFARSRLEEGCRRENIPYRPFTDFYSIMRTLAEELF